MSRFTGTGSRACGQWPPPSTVDERTTGEPRELDPGGVRHDRVLVAVDHEQRARDGRGRLGGQVTEAGAILRRQEAVDPALEPPSHAVLDLLRRVRLGEDLREEELQEPGKSRRQ